jgi:exonuclease III
MDPTKQEFLTIAYMNIRGQTGLSLSKQLQIQDFISQNKIDILHLQEIDICDDTFTECKTICSAFNIFSNNSLNKYGTASLVKSDLPVENVLCDTNGRALVFNINNLTFANIYLKSGSDGPSRAARENYCAEIVPQLLLNRKDHGCLGGDFNCIINKADATRNPESKISPSLKRLVNTFEFQDSFRELHPSLAMFSRYYANDRFGEGASRIDRNYHWAQLKIIDAKYVSVAFSDHMSHVVTISLPDPLSVILSPRTRPLFKVKPDVVKDPLFRERLQDSMTGWLEV